MPAPPVAIVAACNGLETPSCFCQSAAGRPDRQGAALLSPRLQDGLEDFSVGITEVPPHGEGTRHNHPQAAEVWLFFACRGRAIVGDREYPTGPSTVVYTPPGTFHQFVNSGDEPVKLYFLYVPAGEEQAILDAEFR